MTLPEPVPPKLQAILDELPPSEQAVLEDRLQAHSRYGYEYTAESISHALWLLGHHLSASSIRTYRRRVLSRQEVQV